jgi:NAD-dependent dihydropyrimidine dehydrogenase PreA subunit
VRRDGLFIGVEVDAAVAQDPSAAAALAEVCPVDIYGMSTHPPRVALVEENLDECVLCGLCLDATPPGAVRVLKLYDGEAALARAQPALVSPE